jgi:hypothetical protein
MVKPSVERLMAFSFVSPVKSPIFKRLSQKRFSIVVLSSHQNNHQNFGAQYALGH